MDLFEPSTLFFRSLSLTLVRKALKVLQEMIWQNPHILKRLAGSNRGGVAHGLRSPQNT